MHSRTHPWNCWQQIANSCSIYNDIQYNINKIYYIQYNTIYTYILPFLSNAAVPTGSRFRDRRVKAEAAAAAAEQPRATVRGARATVTADTFVAAIDLLLVFYFLQQTWASIPVLDMRAKSKNRNSLFPFWFTETNQIASTRRTSSCFENSKSMIVNDKLKVFNCNSAFLWS